MSGPSDAVLWLQLFVAAFLGFLSALEVDHAHERRVSRRQEIGLLRAARDAVQANLTLSGQLKSILQAATAPPSIEMDVGLLDVVVPRLAETSLDTKQLGEINNWRYQLHHVNRKLDHLLRLVVSGLSPHDVPAMDLPTLVTAIMTNLGPSIILTLDNMEKSARTPYCPLSRRGSRP